MGWADSATGGGYGGDRGGGGGNSGGRSGGDRGRGGGDNSTSGRSSGRGGGGYGGAVGAGVDASSRGGRDGGGDRSTSSGGRLGSELGTVGAGKGYGAGHTSTDSDSQRRVTPSRVSEEGMVASRSFMDRISERKGMMDRLDATPTTMAQNTAAAQKNISQQAETGMIGGLLSMAAGAVNPFAGMAVSSAARGLDARADAQRHNAEFGTDVDTGIASNIGRQAIGGIGGMLGGQFGGRMGGALGSALGPAGAVAGGLIGSRLGKNLGTGLAMGTIDVGQPTQDPNIGTPGGGESASTGGMMAGQPGSAGQPQAQPANPATQPAAMPEYGPGKLGDYASYAQQFFA